MVQHFVIYHIHIMKKKNEGWTMVTYIEHKISECIGLILLIHIWSRLEKNIVQIVSRKSSGPRYGW